MSYGGDATFSTWQHITWSDITSRNRGSVTRGNVGPSQISKLVVKNIFLGVFFN